MTMTILLLVAVVLAVSAYIAKCFKPDSKVLNYVLPTLASTLFLPPMLTAINNADAAKWEFIPFLFTVCCIALNIVTSAKVKDILLYAGFVLMLFYIFFLGLWFLPLILAVPVVLIAIFDYDEIEDAYIYIWFYTSLILATAIML